MNITKHWKTSLYHNYLAHDIDKNGCFENSEDGSEEPSNFKSFTHFCSLKKRGLIYVRSLLKSKIRHVKASFYSQQP